MRGKRIFSRATWTNSPLFRTSRTGHLSSNVRVRVVKIRKHIPRVGKSPRVSSAGGDRRFFSLLKCNSCWCLWTGLPGGALCWTVGKTKNNTGDVLAHLVPYRREGAATNRFDRSPLCRIKTIIHVNVYTILWYVSTLKFGRLFSESYLLGIFLPKQSLYQEPPGFPS